MTSNKQKNSGATIKKRKQPLTIDYKEFLFDKLQNRQFAADYLSACYEEGEDVFLLAIRDVAEAGGGVGALAKAAKLNREGLYDMLSKNGNPRFSSLTAILGALGMKVEFSPNPAVAKAA
jgi:probable addiction module antidote protein